MIEHVSDATAAVDGRGGWAGRRIGTRLSLGGPEADDREPGDASRVVRCRRATVVPA
jgi:hypothetical protein